MNRYWFKITMIGYLSFILMGCNQVTNPNVPNSAAPSPAPGDATQMNPFSSTPSASGLENLIAKAKEDLAQRLSVSVSQINLVDAQEVVWPDSSLGCPQEGMVYAQVLTPGYLILLGHDGNTFEYHASKGNYVITCANPSPPFPGTPDDT